MRPEFRPISVSVISLLGVFLPGLVWTALSLVALDRMNLLRDSGAYLAAIGLRPDLQPWAFVAGYMTLSVVLGALLRPHAMRTAEQIARPLAFLNARRLGRPRADFMFPYKYQQESTAIYPILCKRAEEIIGCPPDRLSRYEPFNTCKRVLRVVSPSLWEEVEYAEAESRMAAGLFLASILAVVLSIFPLTRWVMITLPVAFLFGRGFRRYREREAKYGYLNFAVATSESIHRFMSPPRHGDKS
jgi:hypothetical protein